MHAVPPMGHFIKHAARPNRSLSENVASWALATVIVVAAMQSTDKLNAILQQSTIMSALDRGVILLFQ